MAEIINLIWEYKHLFINPGDNITNKLNELGRDGWECFIMHFTDVGTQCILKKAVADRRTAIDKNIEVVKDKLSKLEKINNKV